MEKLHLIMPMGGRGARFFRDGFVQPKPLIRLRDKPFFYWAVQSVLKEARTNRKRSLTQGLFLCNIKAVQERMGFTD